LLIIDISVVRFGKKDGENFMYECQLCGSISSDIVKVCDNCGYSFEVKEITDSDRIRAYHMRLSKSQNWAAVIRFKKMINDIQIKKHGYSATYSPSGAWSKSKTAALLGEGKVTTSEDIRLAEAVDEYPQLLNCNTKSEANKRLKEIQTGITYKGDRPTFHFEKDLQIHLNSNWSETPFFKEWELQKKGVLKEGRYNTGVVGEMDLLARHREEDRWLVIELKRDQSSDETIGQILRYMGWVKENLMGIDGKVEGLIICEVADNNVRYALKCVPDVKLKIYSFENEKIIFRDAEDTYVESLTKRMSPDQLRQLIEKLQGDT
jgi:ribosomal protein L37E